jgi:hypothetical protein
MCLPRTAKTPISGWTNVASESALLKLPEYYGCMDLEHEKASMRHRGQIAKRRPDQRFWCFRVLYKRPHWKKLQFQGPSST